MSIEISESPTGLIFWGCAASQAIDSSGESLDIEGVDIKDFEDSVAQLNWEHLNPEDEKEKGVKRAPALELVGRVLTGYKVFKASDCRNDFDHKQWDKTKLPFVAVLCRLYDGAGHPGAKNIAAIMRDHHANGEKLLCRLSIEGSTLAREKDNEKRITSSVARMLAITIKPCNRTCDVNLVADPEAPAGFDKNPVAEDLLADLMDKSELQHLLTFENPMYTKLNKGGVEFEVEPAGEDIKKTLTAGGVGGAPSSLTGGAALAVEDRSLRTRMRDCVTSYKAKPFNKTEFREVAKAQLPEVDDSFLDHFTDIAHDYHAKRLKKDEEQEAQTITAPKTANPKKVLAKPAAAPVTEPGKQHTDSLLVDSSGRPFATSAKAQAQSITTPKSTGHQLTILGQPAKPTTAPAIHFDEETGILHLPPTKGHSGGQFPMYIPGNDTEENRNSFHNILGDEKVNQFHGYAMQNWARLNKMLKEGKLPPEVIMHATLFSQLSPNTPVPMQELMYGHLLDSMKHTGIDATDPDFKGETGEDWLKRDNATNLPQNSPEHWAALGNQIRIKGKNKKRSTGSLMSFMLANNKLENMGKYHKAHDQLVDLVNRHKDDARGAVDELMTNKARGGLVTQKPFTPVDPFVVEGLAPKTSRYMMGMIGGGNVMVPDTHFARYLFGLDKSKDGKTIGRIKSALWNENNSHVLNAIDRYYAKHHDAVQHMMQHPELKHLFQNPEQAIFPAFWKNWVSIVPHERARGLATQGHNETTDHRVFWNAVTPFMKSESEDVDWSLPARSATLHHEWVRRYGEAPALMMYYAHIVPKLLENHTVERVREGIRKAEASFITLRKSAADIDRVLPQPVLFRGRKVVPGAAFTASGKWALLHEDQDHYYGVPHEKRQAAWEAEDLKKFPKARENTHFWVSERPHVPVADLE